MPPSPCSRFTSSVSPLNAARIDSSVEARAPATNGTYFLSPLSDGVRSFRLRRVRFSDLIGARRRRCDSVSKPLTSRPSGLISCSSPSGPRVTDRAPGSDSTGASSGVGGNGAGRTSGSSPGSALQMAVEAAEDAGRRNLPECIFPQLQAPASQAHKKTTTRRSDAFRTVILVQAGPFPRTHAAHPELTLS